MQKCVEYLPRKSFNTFGVVLLVLFGSCAVLVICISAPYTFDTSFHCYHKAISKTKETSLINEINSKCSEKYQEKFRTHLIFGLLILNFGVVLALSIIYGYLVKHRVEKFAGTATSNNEDAENEPMVSLPHPGQNPRDVRGCLGHFSTFFIYVFHLIVARIAPLLIFATIFYLSNIPTNFSCPWSPDVEQTNSPNSNVSLNLGYNLTFVGCTNPVGGKSKSLFDVVVTVDVFVVVLTFLELGYLAWLAICDRDFMTDQEFCVVYLLRKRKRIRKFINKFREGFNPDILKMKDDFGETEISMRPFKDIYINVIIQEEREHLNAYPRTFDRHRIYESHLQTPDKVTKLASTAEIFKPKKNDKDRKYPRTILVIGRPGIGKTMLTKKLLYQWKFLKDKFLRNKIVILLQFRTFNNNTITFREMLSHGQGLSLSFNFGVLYETILLNPTRTVLIFDGLDELDVDSELLTRNAEPVSRSDREMPVFSIFKMLVDGRLLPGVTIITTSRPTAQQVFCTLTFDKTVEILGFFEEEIKDYVFKFCKNNNDTAELIWNQIQGSGELLSLCYIPVNSYIVCLTLKESTENDGGRESPKTITELYNRAVNVLIYRHHPIYKSKPRPSDYLITSFPKEIEIEFSKLKEIAKCKIEKGELIFERTTEDEFGDLAKCGFFHKLPDIRRNYFCFLHLTLQEFLAATNVVDDIENVGEFFDTYIEDPKWHLVIQFVAGLVGDRIKKAEMDSNARETVRVETWRKILQERLEGWVFKLGNGTAQLGAQEENIALLGIKCLHELQDSDTMKSVCSKFLAGGDGELCLEGLNITPVDSAALFEFLGNSKNLKRLIFNDCEIRDNYSYKKMQESLLNNPSNSIFSLKLKNNFTTDPGLIVCLSKALKYENCKLTSLDL